MTPQPHVLTVRDRGVAWVRARARQGARWLALAVAGGVCPAWAAMDAAALQALEAGVTAAAAADPAVAPYPAEFRKLVLLSLRQGEGALVFARPDEGDCAATAMRGKARCRVFLMQRTGAGAWALLYTFDQRFHPLAVSVQQGIATALWVSGSKEAAPAYQKISLASDPPTLDPATYRQDDVLDQAQWELDDRNSPEFAQVQRAAGGQGAFRLSPSRVLSDAINAREDWSAFLDASRDAESRKRQVALLRDQQRALVAGLAETLQADLGRVTRRWAWPTWLDVRARKCTDWMVPRAFWLTESRRLASPGFCTDVIAWAQARHLFTAPSQPLALARLHLFDDIGAAYVSRVLGVSLRERQALRAVSRQAQFMQVSAGVGALLAARADVQGLAEREAAYALDDKLVEQWFRLVEYPSGYLSRTPELQRYSVAMGHRRAGLACAQSLAGGGGGGKSCDPETARWLRQALLEIR